MGSEVSESLYTIINFRVKHNYGSRNLCDYHVAAVTPFCTPGSPKQCLLLGDRTVLHTCASRNNEMFNNLHLQLSAF